MIKKAELRRRGRRPAGAARAGLTAATLCVAVLAAGAPAWRSRADVPTVIPASTTRKQVAVDDVELTIRDTGIEPSRITRVVGKFLLTADDRRGDRSQPLTVRLGVEGGEQLWEIEVPAMTTDWAEELDLPAGRYVLTEASHPAWSCSIVVE